MTTQTAAAQQCFRSRPLLQEKGSVVSFFSCMARQECTHGVSLHERACVSPAVPPFLQRLLAVRIRWRIVLRHLQLIGIEFDHLAAGRNPALPAGPSIKRTSPPSSRNSRRASGRSIKSSSRLSASSRLKPSAAFRTPALLPWSSSQPFPFTPPNLPAFRRSRKSRFRSCVRSAARTVPHGRCV